LFFWIKSVELGVIRENCLLVHIDLHSDFIHPTCNIAKRETPKEILDRIKKKEINHDSFICPAIQMGIINNVLFCCNSTQINEFGIFTNYEYPSAVLSHLKNSPPKSDLILDVDIDYFLVFRENGHELRPMSDLDLIRHLSVISEIKKMASLTTIATSPEIFAIKPCWRKEIFRKVRQRLFI